MHRLDLNPYCNAMGILNSNNKIVLLKLNGEFIGIIEHRMYRFMSLVFVSNSSSNSNVYIGTDKGTALVYNLQKLSFQTSIDSIGDEYEKYPVVDLQLNRNNKMLFYQLQNMDYGVANLEKPTKNMYKELINKKSIPKVEVVSIHLLTDSNDNDAQI